MKKAYLYSNDYIIGSVEQHSTLTNKCTYVFEFEGYARRFFCESFLDFGDFIRRMLHDAWYSCNNPITGIDDMISFKPLKGTTMVNVIDGMNMKKKFSCSFNKVV